MKIGLAYDLKGDFDCCPDGPDDIFEEYDSEETVQAVHDVIESAGHEVVCLGGGRTFLERVFSARVDLVFNLSEGSKGRSREAHVPAVLEMLGIPYTHSDPLTMALTLDKEMAKRVVGSTGIATPDFMVIRNRGEASRADLPFPLFVKPAYEGSSKGIRSHSRVNDRESFLREVERISHDYKATVLVETFLPGREFTVGVLGNESPYVLGVMEIAPVEGALEDFVYCVKMKREFAKRVQYCCPPEVPSPLLTRIEKAALGAYTVLGCRDVARIDIRLDRAGIPHFLEANPLPGISPGYSDLVILTEQSRWSYNDLIKTILSHALWRNGMTEAPYRKRGSLLDWNVPRGIAV